MKCTDCGCQFRLGKNVDPDEPHDECPNCGAAVKKSSGSDANLLMK